MYEPATASPGIWALLIGIDCYMPATLQGLPRYGNLSGCVNDISLMEEFLRTRLNVPADHIVKLTASGTGVVPREPPEAWPTKANITAAFRHLARQAQPGDQIYIHYSGHGGRAITLFPAIKGPDGLDESLVPTDYGRIENQQQPEDRYLRDLELARLLQELVERRLIVTAVLDSCHSGGASRGRSAREDRNAPTPRGGLDPDLVLRTPSDLVASPEALIASWEAQQVRGARAASLASGWLPDPQGYTVLAACRALELALEDRAPNGNRHGALSYWLCQTLQSPGLNWEMVHQQVVAKVHGAYPSQTPQLQGVGDRAVFGGAPMALPNGVNVLEVQGDLLRLNIGRAGAVSAGARYFIYRNGVTDFKETDQRVAVVELAEVLDVDSWGRVVRLLNQGATIEPGAQALLFDPGRQQQRAVRLLRTDHGPLDTQEAMLASLKAVIERWESRFVRLAEAGDSAAFQVILTGAGTYEICDGSGQRLPNIQPIPADDPVEVASRLEHLAKYFNVLESSSPDSLSRLSGKLEVKLMRTPEEPFDEPGGIPTVQADEQLYYLRIHNLFAPMEGPPSDAEWYIDELRQRTLGVTVLNLAPDWSIQKLIPPDDQKQFELGPGETLLLPNWKQPGKPPELPALRSSVPTGMREAHDVLKVVATTETTSYDSWQLPPLEDSRRRAALANPRAQEPGSSWITTQVIVRAVR